MTKICLIDGSGYIFRAFYALPEMTAPNGTPVNAVYGVVTMFMRLLTKIDCDYIAVIFDAKRENFRNQIYKDYKANRTEIPELLIPQFDVIHQAVEALNMPWVAMEGYEADDLIATYADMAVKKGWQTVIVSGDKDLMQLIGENVEFYDGMKDKFFTAADVVEKFGVTPDKVVDVQALTGDKVDNIPGVPGIGPKTAAELINKFGSLQSLLEMAEKIEQARRRDLIMQNKEAALISLKLATLNKNSPVTIDLEDFKMRVPDVKTILAFADKYGFKSIRPKLEKWAMERADKIGISTPSPIKKETPKSYIHINEKSTLNNCLAEIEANHQLAFKVWQDEGKTSAISLSPKEDNVYFIKLKEEKPLDLFATTDTAGLPKETISKFLLSVLNNENILKISADIKEQWHLLEGYLQAGLQLFPYHDVSLMSYVLDSSEHGHSLSELAEICLGISLENEEKQDISTPNNQYAFESTNCLLPIYNILKNRIFNEHKTYVYETIERRLIEILQNMEKRGITINILKLQQLDKDLDEELDSIKEQIYTLAGEEFNIASPKQIGHILFEKMGLKGKKNSSGSYNTSAEVLEKLADENELAAKILEWRGFAKLKSTYTTSLLELKDKNDVVHTTFSQTVVNTGRLASSNPNLQNIPNHSEVGRKIRACFVARNGYKLIDADYSQMELRLLAEVANVKALKEAFANGVDIHTSTASKVFGLPYESVDKELRSRAKAINFGIVYGISQYGLAKQIGVSNFEAKQYIDSYFAIMPEIKDYMEKTKIFAHQNGFVETPFGRKCSIFGINSDNKAIVAMAERAAINAPIQGGAADLVKLAMQRVDFALKNSELDAHILLQVHDELVVEAKDADAQKVADLVRQTMENIPELKIKMPVDANISDNWADAH